MHPAESSLQSFYHQTLICIKILNIFKGFESVGISRIACYRKAITESFSAPVSVKIQLDQSMSEPFHASLWSNQYNQNN